MSTIPKSPLPGGSETIEQQFDHLADRWQEETAYLSSTTDKIAHPAFQEIVRMGEAVVPFVLRRMEKRQGHWDLALGEITGEKPFPPSAAGKIELLERTWLDWARKNACEW
jgi:hypothetical protein